MQQPATDKSNSEKHTPQRSSFVDIVKIKLIISFIFRLINAFCTSTFYQPDEYFQSWEVAYNDVYGTGFRSWEWKAGVRTSLVPRFMAYIIKLSQLLNVDHLIVGNVVMAGLAALGDVYTSLLAQRALRKSSVSQIYASRVSWMLSLLSMFNWYCSTRPFSNTFETILVTISLFYWGSSNAFLMLFAQILAHIAIALRPSNAIMWILLGLNLLYNARTWTKRILILITTTATAAVTQGFIIVIDNSYYQGRSLPYLEFVKYNFGARISEIYGVHPWHWYISQGIPFLLFGYIPLVYYGWSKSPWKLRALIVANVAVFSCIAHKEFRFLGFLLPLFHILATMGYERCPKGLRIAGIVVNALAGFYFSIFHQRGVISVVNHIKNHSEITDVTFLMPCHSTPWHAHFQRPHDVNFRPQFLTCEPPWNVSSLTYVDEADQFYSAPIRYLKTHPERLTDTVVVFEPLGLLLKEMGYRVNEYFYNGLFNEDPRRHGNVLLMTKVQR